MATDILTAGLLPPLAAWWFGLRCLKMNTAELKGAVAGARCASSGLRTAQEMSQSAASAIAYTVTFAISSVLELRIRAARVSAGYGG